jgi:hypothetical protein
MTGSFVGPVPFMLGATPDHRRRHEIVPAFSENVDLCNLFVALESGK